MSPQRIESGAASLDFAALSALTFESSHTDAHRARFPGLQLAWEALAGPSGSTAALNAANEVAVESFLAGSIRFDQIHAVNVETLQGHQAAAIGSLDDLMALDAASRRVARKRVQSLAR